MPDTSAAEIRGLEQHLAITAHAPRMVFEVSWPSPFTPFDIDENALIEWITSGGADLEHEYEILCDDSESPTIDLPDFVRDALFHGALTVDPALIVEVIVDDDADPGFVAILRNRRDPRIGISGQRRALPLAATGLSLLDTARHYLTQIRDAANAI